MKTHDPVAHLEHRTTHPDHLPSSAPGLKIEITKMHSGRMRTAARYRTGGLCPGGYLSGGFSVQGVSVWGGVCQGDPLPCGQTDACENVTLP